MKKVLYCALCVPYERVPHAGGQTLNYYIKKISQRNDVAVDLVTYCSQDIYEEVSSDLKILNAHLIIRKHDLKNFVDNLLSISSKFNPWHRYCNIITRNASKLMLKILKNMREEGYYPDVVVMEWTEMVLQIDEIKKIFPKAKFVASEHDVIYLGKRRKAEYETRKIFRWYKEIQARNAYVRETKALDKCDMIFIQNNKDQELLRKAGLSSDKIVVISPHFHQSKLEYKRKCDDIVFFGNMSRDENITAVKWFVDNVMPRLVDIPCRFVVIGGEATDLVRDMSSDKVVIVGYVDQVDEFFGNALCMVVPLVLGAGIKVKVLEAMYSGMPVLTNEIGIEGIPAKDKEDYYHCESIEDYEKIIRELFFYDGTHNLVNGKALIEQEFNLVTSFENYSEKIMEM